MENIKELARNAQILLRVFVVLFTMSICSEVYGVLNASATYNSTTPSITLSWNSQGSGVTVSIFRRQMGEEGVATWLHQKNAVSPVLTYEDLNIERGVLYEYKIENQADKKNSAYVSAGIDVPVVEKRGTLLLVIDNTITTALSSELLRFEQDLRGDGWKVIRHHSARHGSGTPEDLKTWIKARYQEDTVNVKALLLFGHLPICKSGYIAPDGHDYMPLPTDLFYADMDGVWTDEGAMNATNPSYSNLPEDGKYDQNYLPGNFRVELQVGRVDLFAMTAFSSSEVELLRNYLNKNYLFRHALLRNPMRGVGGNSYLSMETSAVHALFGSSKVITGKFENTNSNACTWAVDFGDAVGTNYAKYNYPSIFFINFGSHKQKFDQTNNQMRGILCMPEYGLTCAWGSRPFWFFHHMGMGSTIGYSALRTQNNKFSEYSPSCSYWFQGGIWNNLMGDPTLRMHMVLPPSNLQATPAGNHVQLSWCSSPEATEGYLVYRFEADGDSMIKLTAEALKDTFFVDMDAGSATASRYMVRALKLEAAATGSYYNLSQGVFVHNPLQEYTDTIPPTVPARLRITNYSPTSITLCWDRSTDDSGVTGYEVFKNGDSIGTVDTTLFELTNLERGVNYTFTVQAKDVAGNVSQPSIGLLAGIDSQSPGRPTNLKASNVSKTGLTVSWSASTDNVGVVAYDIYIDSVYYKSTESTGPGKSPALTLDIIGSEIEEVRENVYFAITVKARDISGNVSQASEPLSGILDTESPGTPSGLRVSDVSLTGFTLHWEASTDNVEVNGYYIYVNGVLSRGVNKSTSTGIVPTSYVFTGLKDSTTYTLAVRAFDGVYNQSPISGSLEVVTYPSGINRVVIYENLHIFPNPVDDEINLQITTMGEVRILIYDVLGRQTAPPRIIKHQKGTMTMSAKQLTPGLYYLVVKSDNRTYSGRFMKK